MRLFSAVVAATVILSGSAFAQNVVSAKAGLVHYAEGDVLVAGKPVEKKIALFTTMKPGEVLATSEGRAEVLLGPGSFLRLGENTQVKLVNNELSDVRVQLLQGSVILESAETEKDNKTTILFKDTAFSPRKDGVYSLDAAPDLKVRVWQGEGALTAGSGQPTALKSGKQVEIADGAPVVTKFDKDDTDVLYRWAKRRSGSVALANVSAARNTNNWSSMNYSNGWYWNPYLNMFTFIPSRGIWNSPFGSMFYSPDTVLTLYRPAHIYYGGGGGIASTGGWAPTYNPNYGYNTVPMRTGGPSMGGGGMSAPAPSVSAPAPAAGGGGATRGAGAGHAGGGRGN